MHRRGVGPLALDHVVAFRLQGKFRRRLPGGIAVENVHLAVGRRCDGRKTETGLNRHRAVACGRDVGVVLAEVIVHRPSNRFGRLGDVAEELVLVLIGRLRLVGSIDQPVVQSKAIVDAILRAHAGVIEGQVVKVEGPRIVHLVLGVVAFRAERARPLADVHIQAAAQRDHVGAVSLEDVAVDLRARLVGGIALQGLRGLAELQVKTNAISSFRGHIRIEGKDDIGLVNAEGVAEHVISAKIVNPSGRPVEVVFIIAIEHIVDRGSAGKGRRKDRRLGRRCYTTRGSSRLNRCGRSCRGLSNIRSCANHGCGGLRSAGASEGSLGFQLAILPFERSYSRLQVDDHLFQLSDFITV